MKQKTILGANMLHRDFFHQPTLELAKSLLGKLLVKENSDETTAGYIVETEAYIGPIDKAAHSYLNRRTKRTEVMFGEPGFAYTYVMHTHCLVNVVSGEQEKPEAVLIRALEPAIGLEFMRERRNVITDRDLTNGPGKLTKALGITMEDYGHFLAVPPLFLAEGFKPSGISAGKRIGIDSSEEARDYPWRFWVTDNKFVSRHQKATEIIL
ncbi:DNA-3-methyladenine glycosylase [Bacillus massilinigeriensis]|uniref:DNA-3-methyladenine glycosylase n=1 Tax=Bacillus mediterraneensis TaxID=1805474 RepID=UPI000A7FF7BD|nr:DNA-3-methyladenine glycosylase [Bacillus mediterraneensis]